MAFQGKITNNMILITIIIMLIIIVIIVTYSTPVKTSHLDFLPFSLPGLTCREPSVTMGTCSNSAQKDNLAKP